MFAIALLASLLDDKILLVDKSGRHLITGDFKISSDASCANFEMVECETLVTEATFGLPVFQHPKPELEIKKLLDYMRSDKERTFLLGAYSLGKSQRIIKLLRAVGYTDRIFLHGSQVKICEYYEAQGLNLGDLDNTAHKLGTDLKGSIVIAPPSALRDRWARKFINPLICHASGWMTVKQRARQSLVELPLVISDHADWNELTQTVLDTKASLVWVTHGREDALVHWCRSNTLIAEPLYLKGREEEIDN